MSDTRSTEKRVLAWAWEIKDFLTGEWVLCNWARSSKNQLIEENHKPTPDARMVCVRLVRNAKRK